MPMATLIHWWPLATQLNITQIQRLNIMNNQKCYISPNLAAQFNDEFYRVNNDSNGHPRYVTHYLAFLHDDELGMGDYDIAKQRANKLGFKVYRGKDFGGGFVTTSYNLENDIESIIDAREVA